MKKVKILCVIAGTLIVFWFTFLFYNYIVDKGVASYYGTLIGVSALFLIMEFLVIWIVYGMDIIKKMDF